jgi:Sulfotransferase family
MSEATTKINLDQPYLDQLLPVDVEPVFILGDHRSGTTLLYKTLASAGCFNVVKAYHIIKYDEILYNHKHHLEQKKLQELQTEFYRLGISDRKIDTVRASPELPEEYGFILRNAEHRPYLNASNIALFLEACRKVQFTANPEYTLLLKNPWCFPHFDYIHQAFPRARFIFIHRNPINVINSKFKAVDQMLSGWNAYIGLLSKQYQKIFKNPIYRFAYRLMYLNQFNIGLNKILMQSMESTSYFLEHIQNLQKSSYISIQFEDLCADPQTALEGIFDFLQLTPIIPIDYDSLIQKRFSQLLPTVAKNQSRIYRTLRPYFEFHGYSV